MVAEKLEPSTDRPLHLRVLDLCTGSGCIPLLFHHEYYERAPKNSTTALELVGVDISGDALSLARENLIHQIAAQSQPPTSNLARTRSLHSIGFVQADVLNHESADCANVDTSDTNQTMSLSQALRRLHTESTPNFDLLISNPPYISPKSFRWTTARSVKMYEPTSALVPPYTSDMSDEDAADRFYPSLLSVAIQVNAKAFLFEVADMEQAVRVALKAHEQGVWEGIEIWRDCPGAGSRVEDLQVGNTTIKVRGVGNGRSVFAYRLDAKDGVIP
jgi:methylase of polypeptide subunit release factors